MNRREFLKSMGLVVAGAALLPWKRRFFAGHDFQPRFLHKEYALGFMVSQEMLEDDFYFPEFILESEPTDRSLITLGNLHLPLPSTPAPKSFLLPAKRLAAVGQESGASVSRRRIVTLPMRSLLDPGLEVSWKAEYQNGWD